MLTKLPTFSLNDSLKNKTFKHVLKVTKHRGIANVVTHAIILTSVSIMGVMMLGWSQTSIAVQQQEMNDVYNTQMNKIREDILFENIWFAPPGGEMLDNHLNVTIANVGILGLNVTSIQVTNTILPNNVALTYPFSDAGIPTGDSRSLNVTYAWQSDDELSIRVFTDRGNQFLTQVIVP